MDVTRTIAHLTQHRLALHLDTVDLVFLLYVADHCAAAEMSALDHDTLRALYERAYEAAEPAGQRGATAAAACVDRLHAMRVLARMDGCGLAHAGSFALTLLGQHIVDFHLADDVLDSESLTALLEQIRVQIVHLLEAAQHHTTAAQWHTQVTVPLRTHVGALITSIERRARKLTDTQVQARERILAQIEEHWAAEIASYQAVLDAMLLSIQELRDIAMTGAERIHAVLGDLEARCRAGGTDAAAAVETVLFAQRHLVALQRWAQDHLEGTSAFFQLTQSYLRNVVQLDPGRVLEGRLRDAARVFLDEPWALTVAAEPSLAVIALIRAVPSANAEEWDRVQESPEEIEAQAIAELEPLVTAAMQGGATSVAAVLRTVLPGLPVDRRYAAIGRISAILANRIARDLFDEPQWILIGDGIAVEDFPLQATP